MPESLLKKKTRKNKCKKKVKNKKYFQKIKKHHFMHLYVK